MPIELMRRLARHFARRTHVRDNAVSREDLEQIAMTAMVSAWPKHDQSLGDDSAFLGTAAKRELWNYAAKIKCRPQASAKFLGEEDMPIVAVDLDTNIDARRAINNQPLRTRHILSLVAQGYDNEEIGQQLGLSREAIRLILNNCTANKKRPKRASARARAT